MGSKRKGVTRYETVTRRIEVAGVYEGFFKLTDGREYNHPLSEPCSCHNMECLLAWCPEFLCDENEITKEDSKEDGLLARSV